MHDDGADDQPRLLGSAEVRAVAADLGLRPTKQWGQNFVTDPNTIRRIIRAAGLGPTDVVLEVGPGIGSLTLGLLGATGGVTAVEVDPQLAQALPRTIARYAPDQVDRLTVLAQDALTLTVVPDPQPTALVANLPYNVAVPVLLSLLGRLPTLQHGLVLVQLEVAERLTAGPGSKAYGVPSVKLAWFAESERAGVVGNQVFWPRPRVDSGLVAFRRRSAPPSTTVTREQVFAVIDAAFAQRRKTLRSTLAKLAGSPDQAAAALRRAEVDPGARGETLVLADFVRVTEALCGSLST